MQNKAEAECKNGRGGRQLRLGDKQYGRFTFLRPTSRFAVAIAATVIVVSCDQSAVISSHQSE